MKRHEKLIPLSKAHHQMLITAQVMKMDVPAYKGLPETESQKVEYLKEQSSSYLLKNISFHKKEIYPALMEKSKELHSLIHSISEMENELIEELANLDGADEEQLHEIGLLIQGIVRKRERELYQKIQEKLPDWLNEFSV